MEFLLLEDTAVNGSFVVNCPINTPFHKSEGGCCIEINGNDGSAHHVFKSIEQSVDKFGKTIYDVIDFKIEYKALHHLDTSKTRLYTPINTRNIKGVNSIFHSSKNIIGFLVALKDTYEKKIKPHIHPYDVDPRQLFDIFIDENFKWFRPVTIIPNRFTFIYTFREMFIEMLRLYTLGDECINEFSNGGILVKDARVCSSKTFSKRFATEELKCEYGVRERCNHIKKYMTNDGGTILVKPTVLCKFLLQKFLEDHDESDVNMTLGFTCRLTAQPNSNNIPLVYAFIKLFGRTTLIHRLCLPNFLIKEPFYEWLMKKIDSAH